MNIFNKLTQIDKNNKTVMQIILMLYNNFLTADALTGTSQTASETTKVFLSVQFYDSTIDYEFIWKQALIWD